MRRLAVAISLALLAGALQPPMPAAGAGQPDVLVIYTDDQSARTLAAMPIVRDQLVAKGTRFPNGFVTNPLCCPSRASLLTGTYNHTNGVYNNHGADGLAAFDDSSTIATWLDQAGYRTGLFGKYLNGYGDIAPYTPPGWDRWFAFTQPGYYGFKVDDDGTIVAYDQPAYSTSVVANRVEDFIRNTPSGTPLFAYVAPYVPHNPAEPAQQDLHTWDSLPRWRPRSYDEKDVSDKPGWVRHLPHLTRTIKRLIDRQRRRQFDALTSLDREIGGILQALEDTGRIHNTLIVFASDNGYLWGEHRIWGKNVAYDASVRVPYVVRYDPLTSGTENEAIALNIDIAPTAADMAGVASPGVDGTSLVPLLDGSSSSLRSRFLIEHGPGGKAPAFCAVRSVDALFVRYTTGAEEFYNYKADPWELRNRAGAPAASERVRDMRVADRNLCSPEPPGFNW
jgi:N-acetylglucosamine-6-sulfatase